MGAGALLRALLAAAVAAMTGCATAPPVLTHPELPQKRDRIAVVGVLPPTIRMFEEQARLGMNEAVPRDEWSSAATDVVARAFADEMAADGVGLVPIGVDDPDASELAELYNAVEFSILRHAFEKNTGELVPREPFPEKLRAPDYSLGPAVEFMERHHVDAVWFVGGFNLLPTTGAKVKHGVDVFFAVLGALGGVAVPVLDLQKIQIRAALVDRTGTILYFGIADDRTAKPGAEPPAEAAATEQEPTFPHVDLRDPRAARHYLRAALSGYRAKAPP